MAWTSDDEPSVPARKTESDTRLRVIALRERVVALRKKATDSGRPESTESDEWLRELYHLQPWTASAVSVLDTIESSIGDAENR